jgi:tetratricopeptide (TPR) repeat protein
LQVGLDKTRTERVREMLEGSVRIDLFGLRKEGRLDGDFVGPLGSDALVVERGANYLLEVVLRTLTPGHRFTEGTADSNELWVEVVLRDGERVIAQSGKVDPITGAVDPDAHFVNSYAVDRQGGHIALRNVEEIFTTVYNNQIGPGAADTLHYDLRIPSDAPRTLTLEAKLYYRKFSREMVVAVSGEQNARNELPVVTVAANRALLHVDQLPAGTGGEQPGSTIDLWERWNDYGIGLLATTGLGQLRQAEDAFKQVEAAGSAAGAINLARTYLRGGQLKQAAVALARARTEDSVAPSWTRAWLESELAMALGRIDSAIALLKQILANDFPGASERGFDFSRDYRVWERLGQAYWLRARLERDAIHREQRDTYLEQARENFEQALRLESENADAHYGMAQVAAGLGLPELAAEHRRLHALYRPDDSAQALAVATARAADSAVRRASNDVVVYPLKVTKAHNATL